MEQFLKECLKWKSEPKGKPGSLGQDIIDEVISQYLREACCKPLPERVLPTEILALEG